MTWLSRILTWIGVVSFWFFLGWWCIPLIFFMPLYRLNEVGNMLVTGQAPLLGSNLTLLVPATLTIWYLYAGGAVGRRIFWHVPVLRPALFMAWTMMVATSLAAHTLFLGLLHRPQWRALDSAAAIAVLVAGRVGTSALFSWRPARQWVPPPLAADEPAP